MANKTQWWLAEITEHGNPILRDGPHDDESGAQKAYYLYNQLGLRKECERFEVARVELSAPDGKKYPVKHEALAACKMMLEREAEREGGEE